MENAMKSLFDTARMGTIELKNRLVLSPTWELMAEENGPVTQGSWKSTGSSQKTGTSARFGSELP